MADNQSDLVILGGGSGGYAAALRAAELGKSVVLIEKDKVGGTCLHRGCIPTKALLHAGEIADGARESANFGVNATFEGIDMAGVHKYKDGVVGKNWKGLQGLIKSRGIQTIEGEGRLVGPKTVQVGDDTLHRHQPRPGHRLVLAHAARPRPRRRSGSSPPSTRCSSTTCRRPRSCSAAASSAASSPRRGRASAPRSRSSRRCRTSSPSRTRPARSCSSARSAAARSASSSACASRRSSTPTTACGYTSRAARRSRPRCCSSPSAAARRRPNLGYEEQGVTIERGFVITDEFLRTSVDGVYAVGDLISVGGEPHLQLAHVGFAEGILVAEHIAGLPVVPDRLPRRPAHHLLLPRGCFGRADRGRSPSRSTARTRSRPSPTTCPATAGRRS